MYVIFFLHLFMFLVGCSFRPKITKTTKIPMITVLWGSKVLGGTTVAIIRISTASTMVGHIPHTPMEFAGKDSKDFIIHLNARRWSFDPVSWKNNGFVFLCNGTVTLWENLRTSHEERKSRIFTKYKYMSNDLSKRNDSLHGYNSSSALFMKCRFLQINAFMENTTRSIFQ